MEENYDPWFRMSYAENITSRSLPMPKKKKKPKKKNHQKTPPKTKNPTNPKKTKKHLELCTDSMLYQLSAFHV